MTIVFYDIETTGLESAFDQILQFVAVRTDEELNGVDRFEVRCRLQAHVVPAPAALKVNRLTVAQLTDQRLPSHYQMMRAIHQTLSSWSPALFIGYNSLRFDEHFLRQALFQTLHSPYLTNAPGNARSDALRMMYAASIFAPGALAVPATSDGQADFRLDRIAPANGLNLVNAHDAVDDVAAMIHLCRLVAERAPEVWSAFMRFSQKAAAADFISDEDIFCLADHYFGRPYAWLVTRLGQNEQNKAEHIVFDLGVDPSTLEPLAPAELAERLTLSPKPLRRIRTNAAPILMPEDDAPAFASGTDLGRDELVRRMEMVKSGTTLGGRLIEAFIAGLDERASSPHVELQIYDDWIVRSDLALLDQFHAAPWEERGTILGRLTDARLRKLGQRLIFTERPDLFSADVGIAFDRARAGRMLGHEGDVPWRTLPQALADIEREMAEAEFNDIGFLNDHRAHILALSARARHLLHIRTDKAT